MTLTDLEGSLIVINHFECNIVECVEPIQHEVIVSEYGVQYG